MTIKFKLFLNYNKSRNLHVNAAFINLWFDKIVYISGNRSLEAFSWANFFNPVIYVAHLLC